MSEDKKSKEKPVPEEQLDSNEEPAAPDKPEMEDVEEQEEKQEIPAPESQSLAEHLGIGLRLFMAAVLLCSVIYSALLLATGNILWEHAVRGGLVEDNGEVVGSELIGQEFASEHFFHPRPSSKGYDTMDSGSENLGPTNEALTRRVRKRLDQLEKSGIKPSQVPAGWITESGSALDPHISPAAANIQIKRVSRATGLSEDTLHELIRKHTHGKLLGLFGQPRVNVLLLNLDVKKAWERSHE
jgi:K+-transporting ATPase ATPase C chain